MPHRSVRQVLCPCFPDEEMRHREVKPLLWSHAEEWQSWKTPSLGPESTPESRQCPLHSPTKGVLSVFYVPARWDSCHALHEIPFHYVQSLRLLRLRPAGARSPLPVWDSEPHTPGCSPPGWGLVYSSWPGLWLHQAPQGPLRGRGGAPYRGKASLPRALGLQ